MKENTLKNMFVESWNNKVDEMKKIKSKWKLIDMEF